MRRILKAITAMAVVTLLTSTAAAAQNDAWQRKWYWGVQGGYSFDGSNNAPTFGGHWFITGKRSALSAGFDAVIYGTGSTTLIANSQSPTGQTPISFANGRRLQLILYGIPNDNTLQFYGGAGIGINQVTDARPPVAGSISASEYNQAVNAINELDTKAFLIVVGGGQLRFGQWALFAEYKLFPATDSFLITNDQHQINAGLRYALTHANERIETER
jgi:hypothetical protein